ncbi:MAG TPA: hypothetical protein VIC57_16835 [Candidatus Dormibacteraeota bacterium]|jgi:hypothetical protein
MRGHWPRPGAVLMLELVELPASEHTSPDDGTRKAMAERRRDNIARRCWRLVYPDGSSARVGLFVGVAEALEYARENHWTVIHEEPEEAPPAAVDAGRATPGGLAG